MHYLPALTITFAAAVTVAGAQAKNTCQCQQSSFPAPFSASFQQPTPPIVATEYMASWNQHKWNANLSHITSGFLYNSPSQSKVRADQSYRGNIGSSVFDFANTTGDGLLVANTQLTFTPSLAAPPTVFQGYVNPDFPLFAADFLVVNAAVYAGLVEGQYWGLVGAWDILYQGAIPVTVYVSCCNMVVGYDYFSPQERTRVITEYFNVQAEDAIPSDVFNLPGLASNGSSNLRVRR